MNSEPTSASFDLTPFLATPRRLFAVLAAAFLTVQATTASDASAPVVTTAGLLKEMTDLAALAEFPTPAYTCKQFSSYDRKSKSPTEDWFANGDAGQYLRVEEREGRKEYVMMDAAGPGAIVRIWSANPAGTLRIYLDGSETPALQAPMSEVLGGKFAGLPKPISGEYSKGWNLYFPIPYARHCKVTSDNGKFYYHVNYRTYETGTKVESFSLGQLKRLEEAVAQLKERLAAPPRAVEVPNSQIEGFELELPPSGKAPILRQEFAGPMAIARATVKLAAGDLTAALRGIIVKCAFDGEPTVEVPLGDFFGSAPGINPYSTLPLGMTPEGEMYCHWFMPFKESAVIELVNHTKIPATLTGEITLADYRWTESSMHFHAKWRAQFDVPTRPMQDWNYLTTKGQGVFAGVAFAIDNPVKEWWGEGDEKIYVDGEKFPSHFGTGTEDYYGYAWCWPAPFTHAYHAQSRCDGPGNYGRTSVNRFHILDRIPFTQDFKFDMELWHWNEKCKVNLAVVAYWYARPGATDTFKPIRPEDAVVRPMPVYVVPKVAGAIEGESMKIRRVQGKADPQDWDGISGGKHLWWHEGIKPGDTLAVVFNAPTAGRYQVVGRFLCARDYGIHQLAVNGKKAGEPVDFYSSSVKPSPEKNLGTFELKPGDNEFSTTVVGANEKAVKSYMFGLDYLLLKPAE